VKIDFRRFTNVEIPTSRRITGEYSKYIDVPIHRIDGHDYIMIDQRHRYAENNHAEEDIKGFEDETV
jgi:hypothetical protein